MRRAIEACAAVLSLLVMAQLATAQEIQGGPGEGRKSAVAQRQVVDMAGRVVTLPAEIKNAACLLISSYEKMLLLGQADKIKLVMRISSPWARRIFPRLGGARDMEVQSAMNPNVEDMLENKIDVAFFWNRPEVIQKMAAVGIPIVVPQVDDRKEMASFEALVAARKKELSMHAAMFGAGAERKADAWNRYFEEKINQVYSRTKAIPDDKRPGVYYVRGPDVLTTHSKFSYTWWALRIAGGRPLASGQTKDVIDRVTAEQFVSWKADVIFMGWLDSTDLVMHDAKWSQLPAVVNGKVFISPDGVYRWDHSSEYPLLVMYFAKALYPHLFEDIDMVAETKYFYSKFYDYALTDDEVGRILAHRPPPHPAQ